MPERAPYLSAGDKALKEESQERPGGQPLEGSKGSKASGGRRTLRTQGAGGVEATGITGPFVLTTAVGTKTPREGQRRSRAERVTGLAALGLAPVIP